MSKPKGSSYIGGGTILRPEIDFKQRKKPGRKKKGLIQDESTKLLAVQKNLAGMPESMKPIYLRGNGPKPHQPVIV
jgi:hypothetical protein